MRSWKFKTDIAVSGHFQELVREAVGSARRVLAGKRKALQRAIQKSLLTVSLSTKCGKEEERTLNDQLCNNLQMSLVLMFHLKTIHFHFVKL